MCLAARCVKGIVLLTMVVPAHNLQLCCHACNCWTCACTRHVSHIAECRAKKAATSAIASHFCCQRCF
jgi:hypothetical protein